MYLRCVPPGALNRSRALLCLLYQLFILHRQLCQHFAHPFMDVQVFGCTLVQAHRPALGQLYFLVVVRRTLPVAGTGHSVVWVGHHLHLQLPSQRLGSERIYVNLAQWRIAFWSKKSMTWCWLQIPQCPQLGVDSEKYSKWTWLVNQLFSP